MSGPYRFTGDSARSPLDRQPQNVYPTGQAPSFKTNVNRMKTKKWVEAKKNAYDGDDWGDYDEYDEYGVEQAPPPPQPPAPMSYRPGQRLDQPSRSFTDPTQQAPRQLARRNSFESGDEHRSFSAATPPGVHGGHYAEEQPHAQSAYGAPAVSVDTRQSGLRQASAAESDTSDTPQNRRDFSPSALPPPLHTRMSPAPGNVTDSPASYFPPRKGSIGQTESPVAASPRDRAPSNPSKALPFVRPADIYKRVEEERQRERASMDSTRPSLDSLASRPRDDAQGLPARDSAESMEKTADAVRSLQPLETVSEIKSEYAPDMNMHQAAPAAPAAPALQQQVSLPQVPGVSDFDDEFWSTGLPSQGATGFPAVSPPEDRGFRGVVDQAFTRADDQRSVPPTPISKDSDDTMSRSNTNSTTGISPIMSRVPSGTSAVKLRNQAGGDGSTPVIAEEPSESSTPVSRPTSTAFLGGPFQVPRKPSPAHSRNVSSSSVPRAGLATPSPGESPARSPAIEPRKQIPEPETALFSSLDPSSTEEDMEGGLQRPSASYATREADMAPRSRSESPSKGRVQELAGKFGEVTTSRRGSTQSNASHSSVQSWEKYQDNSRSASPTKASLVAERPTTGREASFRPKLPGQWESFTTTAQTPSEQGERELTATSPTAGNNAPGSALGDVDLTPTTAKHPVQEAEPDKSASDPLAALRAAGTAIGDALQATVGYSNNPTEQHESHTKDRAASSVASSIPPTPPAKDAPQYEELPPPLPLKEKSPEPKDLSSQQQTPTRPTISPQLSTDPSDHDQESDRLRKEIVASLSPLRTSQTAGAELNRASLQPGVPSSANRESSILPSEYDSYWADEDHVPPQPSEDAGRNISEQPQAAMDNSLTAQENRSSNPSDGPMPSLLTRFSWEDTPSLLATPGAQAQADAALHASNEPQQQSSSPTVQRTVEDMPSKSFEGIPDPYFGPGYTTATTKPEALEEAELNIRAPTPPSASEKPPISTTNTETIRAASPGSPASGLHVVNSAVNPEAVDIPPRLSAEVSPAAQPQRNSHDASASPLKQEPTDGTTASISAPVMPPPQTPESTPKSPAGEKPLGFRDIANIKTSSGRIVTYNRTRDYWASADHGLTDWISSAMAANPSLASQQPQHPLPQVTHTGSFRHKPTGSLSLFGKHHGLGTSHPQTAAPSQQQNPGISSQVPSSQGSSAAGPYGPSSGGAASRITGQQMQAKGKDLLHTAGVLGGKGMTGAKGLFAKGKSRFRGSGSGDKVDK